MQSQRIGIINFFGVLIPGSFLSFYILLIIACILEISGMSNSHRVILDSINANGLVFSTGFFFVSYLLGMVIRLHAPSKVDKYATSLLNIIGKKGDWVNEDFPYSNSLTNWFKANGLGHVIEFMEEENENYANKTFFNHCKLYIISQNEALANQIINAEATNRFIAGFIWIMFRFGLVISLFGSIIFAIKGNIIFLIIYGSILFINILIVILLLLRFKIMRRREVTIVWNCYYILKKEVENSGKE